MTTEKEQQEAVTSGEREEKRENISVQGEEQATFPSRKVPKKGKKHHDALLGDVFADFDFAAVELTLESLLKAGVHFGHTRSRRHPKMDPFIHTIRNGLAIIDLERSLEKIIEASAFLASVRESGRQILCVGTKRQTHDLVRSFAKRQKLPFVVDRWLGGIFTNFSVIRSRTKYLRETSAKLASGEFDRYTKFERMRIAEDLAKLERRMGGIKEMQELPGAVLIADVKESAIVVREARRAGIPIVGIVDTNTDPSVIDYPIPGNDDALSSLRFLFGALGKALDETKPRQQQGIEEKKITSSPKQKTAKKEA